MPWWETGQARGRAEDVSATARRYHSQKSGRGDPEFGWYRLLPGYRPGISGGGRHPQFSAAPSTFRVPVTFARSRPTGGTEGMAGTSSALGKKFTNYGADHRVPTSVHI